MANLIGERIKQIRINKKMTQKEVAEKCGFADSALRKYESGLINPKFETVSKIATALGVTPAYLMGIETSEDKEVLTDELIAQTDGEKKVLTNYRSLDDTGKNRVDDYLDDLVKVYGLVKRPIQGGCVVTTKDCKLSDKELEAMSKTLLNKKSTP